jgi:SAM-dependent methyltransferase
MKHLPFSRTVNAWINEKQVRKRVHDSGWNFSQIRLKLILTETPEWEKYYLPIDVAGKTVLDVGAGEGETARFFLSHGAKKVVCIEPCANAYAQLKRNAVNRNIVALNKKFEVTDLNIPHDLLKMDIEGYEEILLTEKSLPQTAAIEIHGLQLRDRFEQVGYKIKYPTNCDELGYGCISYAYWTLAP